MFNSPDTARKPLDIDALEILVVEESDALREATITQLRALGATHIEAACSGEDALQRMKGRRFDVVLSGWNMKLMDGLELLKAIRADDRLRNVAMVMVTSDVEPRDVEQAIAHGVSDLLVKPYTRLQLHSKIVGSLDGRPRANDLATGATTAEAPAAPPEPPTLLVVDDTPENLQVIAQLFADHYRIRVARDGARALHICAEDQPPDLVLLDVMMPGIDGFEVARRMREHPNSQHIPIIFVTALSATEHERRGLDLGAVDFITKPIDPDLLTLRVRNFMRLVSRQKQLQAECDAQLASARLREGVEEVLRHDLKNPLAGAVGFARLLVSDPALSPAQLRMVRLIEDATMHALDMVSLSSEMLRIETGRYELQPERVGLGRLLSDAAALAVAWVERKSLQIRLDLPDPGGDGPYASGDEALCRSVFHNLLRNACEAAPAGSTVTLSARAAERATVRFHNGGAVPPEARERFFDRYVTSGKRRGSGLGTYSARLLTEAQDGHITMSTSDESADTTITVDLPAA